MGIMCNGHVISTFKVFVKTHTDTQTADTWTKHHPASSA